MKRKQFSEEQTIGILKAEALGSASLRGSARAKLRSITCVRHSWIPRLIRQGRSEHGSSLSGNLCPSRVSSQYKSTFSGQFQIAGRRPAQPISLSSCPARRNKVASSAYRAVSIIPIGRPFGALASGKLNDGWPVKLNNAAYG